MTRADTDFVETWETFHSLVNMTSPELRGWLFSTPDGADSYPSDPDSEGLHHLGEQVLQILAKRRTDLTESDLAAMREVNHLISTRLANAPEDDVANGPWRDSLLTLGHDPTRTDSPRGPDAEI